MTKYGIGVLEIRGNPPQVTSIQVLNEKGFAYSCNAEPSGSLATLANATRETVLSNPSTPTGAIYRATESDIALGQMRVALTCTLCNHCRTERNRLFCQYNRQYIRTTEE